MNPEVPNSSTSTETPAATTAATAATAAPAEPALARLVAGMVRPQRSIWPVRLVVAVMDLFDEVLESITRHKLRTVLTAFGIFWGVFMLVLLLGMGSGLRNGVDHMFRDDAINSVWLRGRTTTRPWRGFSPGRRIKMTIDDAAELRRQVDGLAEVTARKSLRGSYVVARGAEQSGFSVLGIEPGYAAIEKTTVMQGRLLNALDMRQRRKVALIGEAVVERLFRDGTNPIGQTITIRGLAFTVIGTFTDEGGEREVSRIFIPLTTLLHVLDPDPEAEFVCFITEPGVKASEVEPQVRAVLSRLHTFDPEDRPAMAYWASEKRYERFMSLFTGIRIFTVLVGLGTLLAGVVGVGNIMLVTVRERTREIGIRKALGSPPLMILLLILGEAFLVTTLAGFSGLVAGVATVAGVRESNLRLETFRDPSVDLQAAGLAVLVLVVAGLAAGLLPARQAVAIRPVEALHDE